jgi:TonB family protein
MTLHQHYIFQSSLLLAVLYGFYWIGLRRDTFFSLNRFYLLATVIASVLVPLVPVTIPGAHPIIPTITYLQKVTAPQVEINSVMDKGLAWNKILGWLYMAGVAFFLLLFLARILKFSRVVSKHKVIRKDNLKLVIISSEYTPFSFFNFVFINEELYNSPDISTILAHEKIHAKQFHTVDILIIGACKIFLWFNPFIWFLERSIKNTHEFIADNKVIAGGFQQKAYQELLFTRSTGIKFSPIANNLNHSPLKKRLNMITKQRSSAFSKAKIIVAIPVILAMMFIFSAGTGNLANAREKQKNQTNSEATNNAMKDTLKQLVNDTTLVSQREQYSELESNPQYPGGDAARIRFLQDNMKYPEEAKKAKIQGKVFIQFIVEKDGRLTNLNILRGIGAGCDEEVLRVVKLMPPWQPGIAHGKPVRVVFNLPIKFTLDNKVPEGK